MRKRQKDSLGRFLQVHQIWHPAIWDDGFVASGRMRVYRPDHPRAFTCKGSRGYYYRSHVVWWLCTGQVVPKEMDLHHRDENQLNDSIDNLELLTKSVHKKYHSGNDIRCICFVCRKEVVIRRSWRRKFCSQECYWMHRRANPVRRKA